jgi:hypothetical protein
VADEGTKKDCQSSTGDSEAHMGFRVIGGLEGLLDIVTKAFRGRLWMHHFCRMWRNPCISSLFSTAGSREVVLGACRNIFDSSGIWLILQAFRSMPSYPSS